VQEQAELVKKALQPEPIKFPWWDDLQVVFTW
jgi:hypothetical protein